MEKIKNNIGIGIYRLLLSLYPKPYLKDYKIPMEQIFRDIQRENSKMFFTIEMCAKFQPKTVPLNTKKLISFNPSFPPSFINNRHTFIYTGKIIEA